MLKEILKEQEEEFDKQFPSQEIMEAVDIGEGQGDVIPVGIEFIKPIDPQHLKSFIQSYNAKIIKAVCEEMTGKMVGENEGNGNLEDWEYSGYNARVQEEQKKAQELESEVNKF